MVVYTQKQLMCKAATATTTTTTANEGIPSGLDALRALHDFHANFSCAVVVRSSEYTDYYTQRHKHTHIGTVVYVYTMYTYIHLCLLLYYSSQCCYLCSIDARQSPGVQRVQEGAMHHTASTRLARCKHLTRNSVAFVRMCCDGAALIASLMYDACMNMHETS